MQLLKLQRQVTAQLRSTPLLDGIANGRVSRSQYRSYLADAYFYAQHSAHVVAHAGIRLATFQPRLSRFMAHRAARRLDHHNAAQADLRDLGLSEDDFSALRPSSPCLRMIALEYFYAKEDNPVGVLGWMFVLQSLGGHVGAGIAESLDRTLDLRGSALKFLTVHGRSNREDLPKMCRFLEDSALDADDCDCFERAVNESVDLYCGMLDVAFAASESAPDKAASVADLRRLLH
jgi:pyrroloquinoline quinone (PQQ) biosynthesis protein C